MDHPGVSGDHIGRGVFQCGVKLFPLHTNEVDDLVANFADVLRPEAEKRSDGRTESRPWGLAGGSPGSTNYVQILRNDGRVERFGMCTTVRAGKGELIRLTTANGGGYGDPDERDRDAIERDLLNGYITLEQAHEEYGLKMAIPDKR